MNEQTEAQLKWQAETTKHGMPVAVLHDNEQRDIVKVYLSPDKGTIRIVLSEFSSVAQIKLNAEAQIIDFRRKL